MDLGSGLNRVYFRFFCLFTDVPSDCGQVASLLFFSYLESRKFILFPSRRDLRRFSYIYGEGTVRQNGCNGRMVH